MKKEKEEVKIEFAIPLQKLRFDVDVTGMFAQVTCTQMFKNENKVPVEAIYVFPLPEDASVTGCEMVIGEKRIAAELKEKGEAKQEYQDAIAAGHHAGLLEQERANIFTMSVGGIEPGEDISIVTAYTQRVPWQDNGGRLTIPQVVAPRFIPGKPTGKKSGGGWAEDTAEVPDASRITPVVLKEGVDYTTDIKVTMSPGFRCNITSPSHDMLVGEKRFVKNPVEIVATDLTPDRDFILCYKTKAMTVEAGVHRGSFEEDEYLTVNVVPPGDVGQQPADVIFCLDISGSMSGAKLEGLKVIAEKVARKLKGDRVAIVAFETHVHPTLPLSKVTDATYKAIQGLESMGGTMAGEAIDHCMSMFPDDDRERYILLVSDGQTADKWSAVKPGVRVVAMGIDTAVNMDYLKRIAKETGGVSFSAYPGEDYDRVASTLAGYLAGPILTDIRVEVDGNPAEDVLGISDVYSSMPASLTFKVGEMPSAIQLIGKSSKGKEVVVPVDMTDVGLCSSAHQIWAKEKLRDQDLKAEELVKLSLKYGVLCGKTAYVAVHLKEVPGKKPERVEIPVSLPATWDYDKVFGEQQTGGVRGIRGNIHYKASLGPAGQSLGLSAGIDQSLDVGFLDVSSDSSQSPSSSTSWSQSTSGSSRAPVHVVDELEDLMDALLEGSIERADAEACGALINGKLNVPSIEQWSATQKAKAFYLLLKLKTYGFIVAQAILDAVSEEPDSSDAEAHEWWEKAQQELGVKVA